jgi:hypothetical protein
MLKKPGSLKTQFAAWITAAFLLFLVFPIAARQSWCEVAGPKQGAVERNHYPAADQSRPDEVPRATATQQPGQQKDASSSRYREYLKRSGFCEETKVTDWALVFFTACLVIVGWFTIRSGERNSRDTERAYIFGTPQIDLEQTRAGNGNVFVEITLQNYGRTFGTVKVIYGEVSATVEPFGCPIYKNGSSRTANGALGPTRGTSVRAPVTFECPVTSDFYFFGYVDYDDFFGRPHTSRFCAKIFIDGPGIEAAGSDAFHDWN